MEVMALVVAVAAFATVAGLVLGLTGGSGDRQRDLQHRLSRYVTPNAAQTYRSAGGDVASILKDDRRSRFEGLDRLLSGSRWAEKQAVELAQAGVPLRVGEYLLIRWLVAFALVAVASTFQLLLPLVLAAGAVGFILPKFYVKRRNSARLRAFDDQLVDALTLMANALRAGSSFLQAMELVARELPSPIAEEFAQTVAEISVGAPVEEALTHLTRRVPSYDLYLAVTAIAIQRSVGGNLSEVLVTIAHTIRERVRILRDVQAKTAEQRLSAYFLGALPLFMLVVITVINPGYLTPMLHSGLGLTILIGGFMLQGLGFLVMRKLSTIEV